MATRTPQHSFCTIYHLCWRAMLSSCPLCHAHQPPPCLPLPLQVVSETSAPALSYEELLDAHPSGEAHKRCRNAPAVYSL